MSQDQSYDIAIIGGLGHVGLPLGLSFAQAGKSVLLYDINEEAIKTVSQGIMPFLEEGSEPILKKVINKKLYVSSDKTLIGKSYFVVIVIGTPIDEHLNPDFTLFKNFCDDIIDNQHLILRSTVFPDTTSKIKDYLERNGKRIKVSFCPERIAQGKAIAEIRSLPQIISSFDQKSIGELKELFLNIADEVVVLSPIEAELGKLFTNVWRYVQFSVSNYFYQIAAQNNIDFYNIYQKITYKYPRASSLPSAGFAAGPCLLKDTMQLVAYSNNNFFMGHASMLVNEGLPNFIIEKLKSKFELKRKTVGILGMAFKADNDNPRDSLAYKLKKILAMESEKVICTDVYIQDESFVSEQELIDDSDIIIVACPHKQYLNLSFCQEKVVVDVWNFYDKGGLF